MFCFQPFIFEKFLSLSGNPFRIFFFIGPRTCEGCWLSIARLLQGSFENKAGVGVGVGVGLLSGDYPFCLNEGGGEGVFWPILEKAMDWDGNGPVPEILLRNFFFWMEKYNRLCCPRGGGRAYFSVFKI